MILKFVLLQNGQKHMSLLVDVPADQVLQIIESDDATTGMEVTPPTALALYSCRPNPFNPMTTIAYDLPEPMEVDMKGYDASGRLIRVLVAGEQRGAGRHEVTWNGKDASGRAVAAGVYFCRLAADGFYETLRMTLVK